MTKARLQSQPGLFVSISILAVWRKLSAKKLGAGERIRGFTCGCAGHSGEY